ncbi:hypothetical protein D3C78_1472870 [compost metagenome]
MAAGALEGGDVAAVVEHLALAVVDADDRLLRQGVQVARELGDGLGLVGREVAHHVGVLRQHARGLERILREVVEGVHGDVEVVVQALGGLDLEVVDDHEGDRHRHHGDDGQQHGGEHPTEFDCNLHLHRVNSPWAMALRTPTPCLCAPIRQS